MKNLARKAPLITLWLFLAPAILLAGQDKWEIGVEPTFTSGDYGTGTKTTTSLIPVILRRFFPDGDLSLTVPYESVTGNGTVTMVGGMPNHSGGMGQSGGMSGGIGMARSLGMMPPGHSGGQTGHGTAGSESTTQSGLGDMILGGRYSVVDEGDYIPSLAFTGHFKIPTANADKGLGTGKADEGIGTELSKDLAFQSSIFVGGGYTYIGKPSGEDFQNQWNYDVGIGIDFKKDFAGSISYEEYRALVAGTDNPKDAVLTLNYKLTPSWKLSGSGLLGLSKGSPDFGFSAELTARL